MHRHKQNRKPNNAVNRAHASNNNAGSNNNNNSNASNNNNQTNSDNNYNPTPMYVNASTNTPPLADLVAQYNEKAAEEAPLLSTLQRKQQQLAQLQQSRLSAEQLQQQILANKQTLGDLKKNLDQAQQSTQLLRDQLKEQQKQQEELNKSNYVDVKKIEDLQQQIANAKKTLAANRK